MYYKMHDKNNKKQWKGENGYTLLEDSLTIHEMI